MATRGGRRAGELTKSYFRFKENTDLSKDNFTKLSLPFKISTNKMKSNLSASKKVDIRKLNRIQPSKKPDAGPVLT